MPNPVKIVILGANGQVGSEAALYLSMQPDVQVTGMVRAAYGAVLLQLADIPWCILDGKEIAPDAAKALSEADAVVDCTFPAGQQAQLLPLIERNCRSVMRLMKQNATFVHSSSISAFGMPELSPELKNYRIPRTSYARIKRLAEQRITKIGRDHSIRTCHLRLGQVHGVLQSVTRQLMNLISRGGFAAMGSPASLCNVAFAHSVAEAYKKAAQGDLDDGQIHTVVSSPQWHLADLYQTYQQLSGYPVEVHYKAVSKRTASQSWIARIVRLATPFRSILESQVLPLIPGLLPRLKGEYRIQAVLRNRAVRDGYWESGPVYNLIGTVPGPIVTDIRSTPQESIMAYRQIEARLDAVLETGVTATC